MSSDVQRKSATAQRPLEWMRFDPVEFGLLCDGLTFAQVGALTKVMLHLWQKGPLSAAEIRRVAKSEADAIGELLMPHGDGLSLDLVEDAREHGKRRVSQRVNAGKASAAKRNGRATDVEQPMNDRSTDVLSMSLSSSSETQEGKERSSESSDQQFESLWIVFERHGVKTKAFEYWRKLKQADRDAITAIAPAYVKSTPGGKYRSYLEGWINPTNRKWERPIIEDKGTHASTLKTADPNKRITANWE